MLGFGRLMLWAAGLVVAALAPAQAQISINAGRTPAQIYAMQCEPCHDKPPTLAKGSPARLTAFLSEHYSESRETAAVLADYLLKHASNAPEPRSATRRHNREAPPAENQAGDAKPAPRAATRSGSKRGEGKAERKPPEVKPLESGTKEAPPADPANAPATISDSKPSESKPSEEKPSEEKPSESKSPEDKSSESKSSETSASDSKPSEAPAGSMPSEVKPPEMPAAEPKATNTNSDTKPSE
jgi:hypothetical protein